MTRAGNIEWKNVLIFILATLLYALCQMYFSIILMGEDLFGNFSVQFTSHYTVIISMCAGDYILLLFLNKYLPYSKSVLPHIVADIVGTAVVCLLVLGLFNYFVYDVLLVSRAGSPSFLLKFAFAMTNNIPILLAFELIYYFRSEQKAVADSEKAKREALLFEHEALRTQINPHFLFNSLNVLSSLIYINPNQANKFAKALSKTYRYVLSLNRCRLVSVEEDLDALESYLFLMRMQFENSFTLRIDKAPGCEQRMIIPLSLQLLMENVFKHNVATEEMPLNITIAIGTGYIEIGNNIQLANDTDRRGIGLDYLTKQYKLYGKEIAVKQDNGLFIVKIPYIQP